MNILFLFISLPDLSETGVFADLIKEFAKQGHKVKVVTPLREGQIEGLHEEAGIEIVRFRTDQLTSNKSMIKKGLAYLKLIRQYPAAIRRYFRHEKFDLIIGHSLPPELGFFIRKIKRYYNASFYLMLCEYIWQDSVSLGIFKEGSIFCSYYRWLEKRIIQAADYIGSPSQGNIDFVLKLYPWASAKKMCILHFSQAPAALPASPVGVRSSLDLENKFIAIYGGSMNIAQKLENVIDLAESCLMYPDIVFLILGKGAELEQIKKDVAKRRLSNVRFIDYMPKNDYLRLLSACDVGIVSLNERLGVPNIPSKTMSYFNMSLPVIAAVDHVTDYGQYLETAGAGLWSYSGDTATFRANLLRLYENPDLRKRMGQRGYEFYRSHMTPDKAYGTIMSQITQKYETNNLRGL